MQSFSDKIKEQAKKLGFNTLGITNTDELIKAKEDILTFVNQNRHGTMEWLAETAIQRAKPKSFFPNAKSVIVVAQNYYRAHEKKILPKEYGNISMYARGRDYHRVLRKKLKKLMNWILVHSPHAKGRIFVDSFPIMEKPLAVKAGLGWIGKNSTLIIKGKGSYYFLGGILLDIPLQYDQPYQGNFCGSCNRCQIACPTQAITDAYQIDASRCISYLTIEHRNIINTSLQNKMRNYIFGCDICQIVCPWNIKYATQTNELDFSNRIFKIDLLIDNLLGLNKEEYIKLFEGTPVRRTGFHRFRRNVTIALKNKKKKEEKNF